MRTSDQRRSRLVYNYQGDDYHAMLKHMVKTDEIVIIVPLIRYGGTQE